MKSARCRKNDFSRPWRAAGRCRSTSCIGAKRASKPGDIRSLADIEKIPPYTVHELRESIERNPPWGDYLGVSLADGAKMPLVLQTCGGTTGLPRPMIYAPRDREVMSIMGGRRLMHAGRAPGRSRAGHDVAGPDQRRHDGARIHLEVHRRDCTDDRAAAPPRRRGARSSSRKAWKTTVMLGIPSYIRHLGIVARDEMNIDPRSLGIRLICCGLGPETARRARRVMGRQGHAAVRHQRIRHDVRRMSVPARLSHIRRCVSARDGGPETHKPVPHGEKGNTLITACISTRRR